MSIEVIEGDCLLELPKLAPASIDLVIADPPYGETSLSWDSRVAGWIDHLPRILKPSGSLWCFGSFKFFMASGSAFWRWNVAQDVIWEKHNGSGSATDRFRRVHEHVVQFWPSGVPWGQIYKAPVYTMDAAKRTIKGRRGPEHWGDIGTASYETEEGGPRLARSVQHVRSCHGYAVHPTQKPTDLIATLIEHSCPEGGVVLDPFAGSGSTGVAAMQAQRNATLIELNPTYAEMARNRIAADRGALLDMMEATP